VDSRDRKKALAELCPAEETHRGAFSDLRQTTSGGDGGIQRHLWRGRNGAAAIRKGRKKMEAGSHREKGMASE